MNDRLAKGVPHRAPTTMNRSPAPLLASMLLSLLAILAITSHVTAQDSVLPLVNSSCNPSNTRLLIDNNQLTSDCGYVAWCDSTDSICKVRGCRRDEYPFGFNTVARHLWPELCRSSQFCPDEGSFCLDKVGLGQPCQLGRDDQCLQSESGESVRCLRNVCVAVNATQDATCIYENTIYTDFTDRNNDYGDIISRDNCLPNLYCNSPTTTCLRKLAIGVSCSADKECVSGYCNDASYLATVPVNNNFTGTCGENRGDSNVRPWVYVIVIVAILLVFAFATLLLLRIHISQTKKRKAAREEYWQGQRSISEHARLLDDIGGSSNRNSFSTRPASMVVVSPTNMRTSSNSSSSDHNSHTGGVTGSEVTAAATSPIRRERQSTTRRYSDIYTPSRPESFAHPLQQQYSAYENDDDDLARYNDTPRTPSPPPKDDANKFITPPQSIQGHTLQDSVYRASDGYDGNAARATSSAVEQQPQQQHNDDDVRIRNRDVRAYGDGWRSPDTFVSNGNGQQQYR